MPQALDDGEYGALLPTAPDKDGGVEAESEKLATPEGESKEAAEDSAVARGELHALGDSDCGAL